MICLESSAGIGAGLGNQLFRYAFVRSLQLDTGESIVMYDYHRAYDTGAHQTLKLPQIVPSTVDITYVDCPDRKVDNYFKEILPIRYYTYLVLQKLWRYAHGIWKKPTDAQLNQLSISLQPLLNLMGIYVDIGNSYVSPIRYHFPSKFYCMGYFFSRKYFEPHEEQIRKELNRPELISAKNQQLLKKMHSCNAVCVHMRYGDFTTTDYNRRNFYVCDETYYEKAIQQAYQELENPVFFVFSDEYERAKKCHFPQGAEIVYVGNDNSAIEDLQLIAQCKHFVIPNSTFSWWGQFLSTNPNKKVYAPSRWFRGSDPDNPNGLYEKTWTIVHTELPEL